MNNDKNRNFEDLLGSLDHSQRAEAPAFFYTRLKARMERELLKNAKSSLILRPVYALSALALLLLLNAVVILQKDEVNANTVNENENVQSIAAEYSLNDNTIYDLTLDK